MTLHLAAPLTGSVPKTNTAAIAAAATSFTRPPEAVPRTVFVAGALAVKPRDARFGPPTLRVHRSPPFTIRAVPVPALAGATAVTKALSFAGARTHTVTEVRPGTAASGTRRVDRSQAESYQGNNRCRKNRYAFVSYCVFHNTLPTPVNHSILTAKVIFSPTNPCRAGTSNILLEKTGPTQAYLKRSETKALHCFPRVVP